MNRRNFVKAISAGTLATAVVNRDGRIFGRDRFAAPSDQIRLGVIGPGSRGQELMRYFLRVPGVRITGLCDIYEPRFAAARKITGEETPVYRDYRRLLEARDIDAVVVATPLNLHAEHVLASLQSGRHVYGEKSMGLTLEHCNKIVDAVQTSGKHFQVGHQYRYAPWFKEVAERVGGGEIGRVTHIYCYWHRNGNWRRPVPDPKFERLINWRLYKEYSGGLTAELGSHHIDFANWIFGVMPESVTGSGGIDTYHDGRETNDNVQIIFRYPGGRTLVFSSLTDNAKVGAVAMIYGKDGSVEVTMEDAIFYYEPKKSTPVVGEVTERGVPTGATYSTKGEMPYRGPGKPVKIPETTESNPNLAACRSFIDSLGNNTRPFADEQAGWRSAVSVYLANKAIDEGRRIVFADHLKKSRMA
jgi:predicted dehydrogenase